MSDTVTGLDIDRLEELAEKLRDIAETWLYDGTGDRPLGDGSAYAYLYGAADAVPSLLAAARAVERVEALVAEMEEVEALFPDVGHGVRQHWIDRFRAALGTEQEGRDE